MRHRNDLPVLIERWFTDRLMKHRGVSPNTIASYRDGGVALTERGLRRGLG